MSTISGNALETSAFQCLYGGQFTLSTLLINQIFVFTPKSFISAHCFAQQKIQIKNVSILTMCSVQEKQRVDRELLELMESPVNPAFLNMIQPLIGGLDPLFYRRTHGEALWEWGRYSGKCSGGSHVFSVEK